METKAATYYQDLSPRLKEMAASPDVDVIIIGAGPSGISMAYSLKHELGFDDFTIYDKLDGVGGTWLTNTYPGVGCDVPTILYSFHFNLNPNWSKELCDGPEILEYMNATVDKFSLRPHIHLRTECLGASWNNTTLKWDVHFHDNLTKLTFTRSAKVFISAVGGISFPRDVRFPGQEKFKGELFHTARWNHNYDYRGKRVAVIGNGCSAAQVVPALIDNGAGFVKQYARSPQWYHERPNRDFSSFEKWCMRWIPLWERWIRLSQFQQNDNLVRTYMAGERARKEREAVEKRARDYVFSVAPQKYHGFLIPDFPLGCKRRIFDPGYLSALNAPNVELVPETIQAIDETGIINLDGTKTEFDLIVYATGFQVQQFLTPMEITGRNHGQTLNQHWKEHRGAQAYMGSYVNGFPNFAILFGPNTFPAHNSALFSCEVQVSYVAKTLLTDLVDKRAEVFEVKGNVEDRWVNGIHEELKGSVFQAGCSNWYMNEYGRNSASWPGYASMFWWETVIPRWGVFTKEGGSRVWVLRRLWRWVKMSGFVTRGLGAAVLAMLLHSKNQWFRELVTRVGGRATSLIRA
ncbi:hypothetical protein V5O48_015190 [Marasmius crinis-equi]|uniref:Monooxygenase n=1 Tax=Marasmius crinis-equi TaxID=585013 RepID=A0ABR3EV87_9AGAR